MPENGEKIVLGSGKLYLTEWDGITIPADGTIEVEANLLGLISGGATLEYKPSFYEAEDDLGLVKKKILTKEEVTMKSGVMTWCGRTLAKLCSTARTTETGTKRTIKIGGISNQDGKLYVLRFIHEDDLDGDIRVTIVGSNEGGFSLAFAKDKETVIDAEFKAAPSDTEGTLIIYEEEVALGALAVTSVAGSVTGKTKITVLPALTGGFEYVYKTAVTVTLPDYGTVCTDGYSDWDGVADITATTGNEIMIIEVDADHKAINGGKATVVSKA